MPVLPNENSSPECISPATSFQPTQTTNPIDEQPKPKKRSLLILTISVILLFECLAIFSPYYHSSGAASQEIIDTSIQTPSLNDVNPFTVAKIDRHGVAITSYTGTDAVVVIPETINGKHVKTIRSEAFKNCDTITSISIPSSVTNIEDYAFSNCTKLISVILPRGIKLENDSFWGSDDLNELMVYEDTDEDSVMITRYVCAKTEIAVIPETIYGKLVTKIGPYAFEGCVTLTSITLPDTTIEIGDFAFSGCAGLESFTIPSSVTSIGVGAFFDCNGLSSIFIPNSVIELKAIAFYDCTSLRDVYYGGTKRQWVNLCLVNQLVEQFFVSLEQSIEQSMDVQHDSISLSISDSNDSISINIGGLFYPIIYPFISSYVDNISEFIESSDNALTFATIHYSSPIPEDAEA